MNEQSAEQQRAEIRKLLEQVQRAVSAGQIRFIPDLDRRIREQIRQAERSQDQGVER
jgi:hypothetical protein